MPRRKQAKRTTVKDLRSILRLTHEHGLSVRAISERLQVSKTSVATYLLRAREAGLGWMSPKAAKSVDGRFALQPSFHRARWRLSVCAKGAATARTYFLFVRVSRVMVRGAATQKRRYPR
jgi:hypothetical protein